MVHDQGGGPITLRVFILYMVIPYMIGVYYSKNNLPFVRSKLAQFTEQLTEIFRDEPVKYSEASAETCLNRLLVIMHEGKHKKRHDQPFANLTIVLHPNGQHDEPCGRTEIDIIQGLENLLQNEPGRCPLNFEKYQLEALLTRLLHSLLEQGGSCHMPTTAGFTKDLYSYCDRGKDYTPILPDHEQLVPIEHGVHNNGSDENDQVAATATLPCHYHSAQGIRITSLPMFAQLARLVVDKDESITEPDATCNDNEAKECAANNPASTIFTRELHLYAVPAGRVFMFPAARVGETIPLLLAGADPKEPIVLTVLSTSPRVFDVSNFFDRVDSDDLVQRALEETREAYRIKKSTVGVTKTSASKRTSESGFDTNSRVATKLKRRGMSLLGFDEYIESFTDGLQILRYNETTAYNSHLDWMEPSDSGSSNFESMGVGGNRFATIFLYLSDLGEDEGGETVFPKAALSQPTNETESEVWRSNADKVWKMTLLRKPSPPHAACFDLLQIIDRLRKSGVLSGIKPGSWEENLVSLKHFVVPT